MSIFVPRDISGAIAHLERKSDGGSHIVIWDGPENGWIHSHGTIDGYELMTAPPASDRAMVENGIPPD